MAQERDVIELLTDDHRAVDEVFTELDRGEVDVERRKQLVDHVITELVRHSVAEEQYVYPAMRKHLDNGDELADHEIAEHAEAEKTMQRLEAMDPKGPEYFRTLRTLIDAIRHHVQDEENESFPRLAQACSKNELRELAKQVRRAKDAAPTRPHPSAPDSPPANRFVDAGAGMIDRVRDALTGRLR